MAWYNKYRPRKFEDVIGQDVVKTVLEKSLILGKIKHAYLFNGPKGVGKTTIARIFAGRLNQIEQNSEAIIDLVEMDAASNTGIDDVRLLIESAKNPPLIGKYKIYLIDEVHMLSKPAMNALLKILEEPPTYLVFLLATTNPEKLIPTVLSRLTRLNLSNHSNLDLAKNLGKIASLEGMQIEEDVLNMIAKRADGSQRDAINLLETLYSFGLDNYSLEQSSNLLGLLPDTIFAKFASEFQNSQSASIQLLETIRSIGLDGESFLAQLLVYLLDESFTGNNTNKILIQIVAKVLDLQLPATTILQSIALLQSFWPENYVSTARNIATKVEVTTQTEAKPKQAEIQNTFKPEYKTEQSMESSVTPPDEFENSSQNETVIVPNSQQNDISNNDDKPRPEDSQQTINSLQNFMNQLGQHKELPPMLKMVIPDIKIEEVANSKAVISASSGIFLAQLNSPKIQSWLLEQVQKVNPSILQLQVIQRSNSVFTPTPTEPVVDPVPIRTQEIDKKYNHPEQGGNKYFYEVYSQLPQEMEAEALPVFAGEIKKPIKTKSWDDHASELFDFE